MASVWFVNHYAYPPDIPGGTRHYEMARRLVKRGYDVTVVASSFHHATRQRRFGDTRKPRVEMVGGVRFVWMPSRTAYKGNGILRAANMLEFAWRVWRGSRACFSGQAPVPYTILGSSPHLFAAFAACQSARRFRVPFLLEIRDLWPETFVQMGVFSRRHPLVQGFCLIERVLYRHATRIISLLPSISEYLDSYAGAEAKVDVIPNGVDIAAFNCPPLLTNAAPLQVVYVGAHGPANGLSNVLDAASKLQDENVAHFHFYGEGPEKTRLEMRAATEGLANVFFHPAIPKTEVPTVLCKADCLLLHYARIGIGRYGISPNKLWEYMASRRPVLFVHEAGDNPVNQVTCGLTVTPEDPAALCNAVRLLAHSPLDQVKAMAARGRAYAVSHHDWDQLSHQLADILDAIRKGPGRRIHECCKTAR